MTFVAVAVAMAGAGGGTKAAAQQPQAAQKPRTTQAQVIRPPLEALAQQHILVLPVQYVTFADSLGWSAQVPSVEQYLRTLDDELTFALGERGLKKRWTFPAAIARTVKRNPAVAVDPYTLDAEQVRIGSHPDTWQLGDPLASQLRSLIALDEARYVLFPVELRLTSVHNRGQAKLHVVIIDARSSQIQWTGDILGTPASKLTPAVAADLASHLADLVVPGPH